MIAYNREWLTNRYVQEQADEALHEQYIDQVTYDAICKKHEVKLYTPNFFVRVGLGFVTFIIVVFSSALIGLMFESLRSFTFVALLIGVGVYFAAEMLIRAKAHYNSGVDNMLVWLSALCLWCGIVFTNRMDNNFSNGGMCCVAMIICFVMALRWADSLMSILATMALLGFVFFSYLHLGAIAKATAPFVMMLVSGIIYFVTKRLMGRPSMLLYRTCLLCANVTALVALYASGNYYLVRELSNAMFGLGLRSGDMMPMGWMFWLWTFLVPVVYIGFGIRIKDITLIRVGMPLVAVAVLTFRNYYHVMPPEMAMMLGGLIVFVISYSLINYLRVPKGGFTFRPETFVSDKPNIGQMITAELINNAGQADNQPQGQGSDWG